MSTAQICERREVILKLSQSKPGNCTYAVTYGQNIIDLATL